jgi:hypothetical protein
MLPYWAILGVNVTGFFHITQLAGTSLFVEAKTVDATG